MFSITGTVSALMLGRKLDRLAINKDDCNICDATTEPKVKETSGDEDKKENCVINHYCGIYKKERYCLEELLPLTALKEGQRGKIVLAVCGRKLISRLCDLGLTPETEFRVLKKGLMEGPIIVDIRSCKLTIGREIASNVLVKPL